ncbi:MAG: ABC transporter ATP-binding protein [Candidatus Helarchaeota archaeon]
MTALKSPFVELRNITKSYDDITVLHNVSLQIPYNSYFCICGPTGSGKSTLLKLIAGLETPDTGEIYINKKPMNDVPPEDRGIGMLFEHMTYALFPHYSIYENIIYGPRVKGRPSDEIRKNAREMLQLVLLEDRAHDLPGVMSGGMKQRVALARALMTGSKLLLLDEPLSALDAKIRLNMRKELVSMVKSLGDLTIIHVTQDIEEALMVSDYIAILFYGNILQIGTPEELYNSPNCIEVCNFLAKTNFFEGTVIETTASFSLIDISIAQIRILPCPFPLRDNVVVAIRATDMNIQKEASPAANQLKGRILRHQFIHGTMRYEIELVNKKIIIVIEPYEPNYLFDEGSEVTVSFDPESPLLFPHPGDSLEKILAE